MQKKSASYEEKMEITNAVFVVWTLHTPITISIDYANYTFYVQNWSLDCVIKTEVNNERCSQEAIYSNRLNGLLLVLAATLC